MRPVFWVLCAAAMVACSANVALSADPATTGEAAQNAPDNTGRNVRDRGDTLTTGDQSEKKEDIALTQEIRQAIIADESLSMTAKNIKIITIDGIVTLRGPVSSDAERQKIAATAAQIAGKGNVQNHLEVAAK